MEYLCLCLHVTLSVNDNVAVFIPKSYMPPLYVYVHACVHAVAAAVATGSGSNSAGKKAAIRVIGMCTHVCNCAFEHVQYILAVHDTPVSTFLINCVVAAIAAAVSL
eukprot:13116-Heterococcus_DN1.PRE.1